MTIEIFSMTLKGKATLHTYNIFLASLVLFHAIYIFFQLKGKYDVKRGTYYHIRLLNVLLSIFPVVLFVALWCSFHGQYFEIFVCLVTLKGNYKQCETICSGFARWQI